MIEWTRGGWTGSVNRWVRREVRELLRKNPTAQGARYSPAHRALRWFFAIQTFGRFIGLYILIDVVFLITEMLLARYDQDRSDVPADREQNIRLEVCQLCGQFGEALGFPFCVAVRDNKIPSLDVAEIAQATSDRFHLGIGLRSAVQ